MRCANCGYENPETATVCASCGRELATPGTRRCVSCGRSIAWEANVCPYCGKDYREQALPTQKGPLVSTGLRILLYILSLIFPIIGLVVGIVFYLKPEQEYKHVGKICLVLGIVAIVITIGLAALLYVLVLGFGGVQDGTPALYILRKTSIADGFKIELGTPTMLVEWSEVTMALSDGLETVSWHPRTQDMTSLYPPASYAYGMQNLGGLIVTMNATDLSGDGRLSMGDYITFTTTGQPFSIGVTYTLTVIYEPTGGAMVTYPFTG